MATDRERDRALKRERNRLLGVRTRIQAETAREVVRLLRLARGEIRAILADAPTDFQAFQLPQIERSIRAALAEFEAGGTRAFADGATRSFQAGQALVEETIAAGGLRIAAVLPEIDTRQLQAMRTFLTGRIRDITSTMADRINTELGLVTIGVKTPAQAASGVQEILGAGRSRAITITRTELGRAFSVAGDERLRAAKEQLPGLKKQWRRSGKLHERPHHRAIDGQVREVDEPFTLANGVPIMFPRDPRAPAAETINCGCESLPFMEEWGFDGHIPVAEPQAA